MANFISSRFSYRKTIIFLCFFGTGFYAQRSSAYEPVTIVNVQGSAKYKLPSENTYQDINVSDTFSGNELIQVSAGNSLSVSCPNGSIKNIEPRATDYSLPEICTLSNNLESSKEDNSNPIRNFFNILFGNEPSSTNGAGTR